MYRVFTVDGGDRLHIIEVCPALARAASVTAHDEEDTEDLDLLSSRYGVPICGTCLRMRDSEAELLLLAESVMEDLEVWPDAILLVTRRLFAADRILKVPLNEVLLCSAKGPGLFSGARLIIAYANGRLYPADEETGPGEIDFLFEDKVDRDEVLEFLQQLVPAEPAVLGNVRTMQASSVARGPSLAAAVPVPLATLRVARVDPEERIRQVIRRCPPVKVEGRMPRDHSVRASMTAAKNQKEVPSCVSFAVNGLLEYVHGTTLSEASLMDAVEVLQNDGKEPRNSMADVVRAAREVGAVEERWWPYDTKKVWDPVKREEVRGRPRFKLERSCFIFCVPRETILQRMRDHQLKFRVSSTEDMGINPVEERVNMLRQHLARRNTPVLISFAVIDGTIMGKDIRMPQSPRVIAQFGKRIELGKEEWHAVLLTAYDDSTRKFEFKNSWGHDWEGDHGYGTIDYEFINWFADCAIAGPPRKKTI